MSVVEFLKGLTIQILNILAASHTTRSETIRLYNELKKISEKIDAFVNDQASNYPSAFVSAISIIIGDFEGGYSKSSSDPGGATMFGISTKSYPQHLDAISSGTFTKSEAINIYFKDYWSKLYNIEKIHPSIAFILLDSKIHGSHESISDIQTWLNDNVQLDKKLKVDGDYGEKTFAAIQKMSGSDLPDLIKYLESKVETSARIASTRVLKIQKKLGLETYDYFNGFRNRLSKRYSVSMEIFKGESLYA